MRRVSLACWSLSLVTLAAAAGGLSALTASSTNTSGARMAGAAAVLSVLSAVAGLLPAPPAGRRRLRCLLWGGSVSLVVCVGTAASVGALAGVGPAVWAALPWLAGPVLAWAAGPRMPAARLPELLRAGRR